MLEVRVLDLHRSPPAEDVSTTQLGKVLTQS